MSRRGNGDADRDERGPAATGTVFDAPPLDRRSGDRRRTDPTGGAGGDGGDEILTSQEARTLLKIGRTKLWELTRNNVIPAYRIGQGKTSGLRYRRSELLAFLEKNRI